MTKMKKTYEWVIRKSSLFNKRETGFEPATPSLGIEGGNGGTTRKIDLNQVLSGLLETDKKME